MRLLLERFDQAKAHAEASLRNLDFPACPLPWLGAYVNDAIRRMGPELWPYGLEANRHTLAHFGRLIANDGLTSRTLSPEDVFNFR
jgi:4,5-dihydroxyphthalate decarboxylase